jgi:hypothetical protein
MEVMELCREAELSETRTRTRTAMQVGQGMGRLTALRSYWGHLTVSRDNQWCRSSIFRARVEKEDSP